MPILIPTLPVFFFDFMHEWSPVVVQTHWYLPHIVLGFDLPHNKMNLALVYTFEHLTFFGRAVAFGG